MNRFDGESGTVQVSTTVPPRLLAVGDRAQTHDESAAASEPHLEQPRLADADGDRPRVPRRFRAIKNAEVGKGHELRLVGK